MKRRENKIVLEFGVGLGNYDLINFISYVDTKIKRNFKIKLFKNMEESFQTKKYYCLKK